MIEQEKRLPVEEYKITMNEARRILHYSAESIRAYERKGKLTAVKIVRGMRLFRTEGRPRVRL